MRYDFNKLEKAAAALKSSGRDRDALRIYLYMADGDPSLDGGYLSGRIAQCYEKMGELDAARFWCGRAVEENPEVRLSERSAYERIGRIVIEDLCGSEARTSTEEHAGP